MLLFNSFTYDFTRLDFPPEAQLLRSAYLFSDKLLVSGTAHTIIGFEHYQNKNTLHQKDEIIMDFAQSTRDEAHIRVIGEFIKTVKQSRQRNRHETAAMIVARKKLEKSYDQLFQATVKHCADRYHEWGFCGLLPLVEEYAIDLIGPANEINGNESEIQKPYSKILSCKWNEADEVYIFSHPFWEYAATRDGLLTTAEESDEEAGMITFRLPDLPKLISFSAAELKLIRHEVFEPLQLMRKAVEEWSLQLRGQDFSMERAKEYRQYFKDELESDVAWLRDNINASELLQKAGKDRRGLAGSENYLAITSARTVWDYMEWGGLVPKESMHIFEQHPPVGCNGDKAVLVFLSMPLKEKEKEEKEEEDGDKKSLIL